MRAAPDSPMVRPCGAGDRPTFEALLRAADLMRDGLWSDSSTYVVAEHGRTVLGGYGLEIGARACLMRSVVIGPDARGFGLGRLLEADARARSRAHGAERLYCFSTDPNAVAFFQHLGWRERPVAELVEALPDAPQVRVFQAWGTLPEERAWRIDLV